LRLAADQRHPDENGREMLAMGRKPYMWRNHWLWSQRKRKLEDKVADRRPEDYCDDPPRPHPFNDPPPTPPAPFV
jgi:hypothetical protein